MYDLRFRKNIKKGIALVSLVLLLLQQSSFAAFAQTSASPSAQASTISVGSPSAILLPQDPASQAAFLGITQLSSTPAPLSASVAQPTVVSKLPKKSYKAQEQVEVTVGNSQKDTVGVQIIDSYGLDATDKFVIQKFVSGTNTIVDITPPQSRFKPGKYTLKISDGSGNATTQDFTWGVLAINTNKSIYLPSESANIAMAVLDEGGNMVCDADVTLTITDPQNHVTSLSTTKGDILVNDICTKHEFSLTPDYETVYTVGGAGKYTMDLSATTKNGTYSITDTFSVENAVDFDVARSTATRLYPPLWYPVTLTIKASKDFSGVVTDYVPATFDVHPATSSSILSYSDVKTVYPGNENTLSLFGLQALRLSLPFTGVHEVEQGFGEQLTDPKEKQQYSFYHVLGHDGIDFAMPIGTAVLAADDGVVVLASKNSDYGTTIVVRHSWGQSYYGHLSTMEVSVGSHVTRGQEIAKSGNTGLSSGAHLHFGIKPKNPQMDNGFFGKIDPAPYLALDESDATSWNVNTRLGNQPLKVVQWKVDVKKGETISLGYQFKAPNVSPEFYTLGPAHFISSNGSVVFSEARSWQLAADVSKSGMSLSNIVSGVLTGSWADDVSSGVSDTTTIITYKKNTGYFQWIPGTSNAPSSGAVSAPTTPSGKGWIFDTPLDSTIPSGTWSATYTTTATSATGTVHAVLCAWKVKLTGSAISSSTSLFTCGEGSANLVTGTAKVANSMTVASVAAASLGPTEYIYVEPWIRTTVAGTSNTAKITFNTYQAQVTPTTNTSVGFPSSSSNLSPNAPTQSAPANGATGVSTTPTFTMSTTDPETDNLGYKVTIYSNSGCSSVVQTNDQASSSTGWSGTNATCTASPTSCYTSGTTGTYAAQSALSGGTQYWWKASAKDPDGSNAFTDSSTCNSFTTTSGGPATPSLDQLLRHGEWFNSGVSQPFTF